MADVSDNYLYTDTDLAELSISLGVIIPTISYAIAREIHNKIPIKKVYLNSKRFDEQKVWSLYDFSEKRLFENKKYRQ